MPASLSRKRLKVSSKPPENTGKTFPDRSKTEKKTKQKKDASVSKNIEKDGNSKDKDQSTARQVSKKVATVKASKRQEPKKDNSAKEAPETAPMTDQGTAVESKVKDAKKDKKDIKSAETRKKLEKRTQDTHGDEGTCRAKDDAKTRKHANMGQLKAKRMLHDRDVVLDRFAIEGMIGGGGFAQIYLARDKETKERCAVKMESVTMDVRRMKLEATVLMVLRGTLHIPEILAMGKNSAGHFLVLQLVGKNLSDIRRMLPHRRVPGRSLYRVMSQIIDALCSVHSAGFVHRDLKPSNCCVGTIEQSRIYLVDYGLAKQFMDLSGNVKPPRKQVGIRGTTRYMSRAAHARKDLAPVDDIEAWLYSLFELGDGGLPWSKVPEEAEIGKMKLALTAEKFCERQKKRQKITEYVLGLKYSDIPDYDGMKAMLLECLPDGFNVSSLYEWEKKNYNLEHVVIKEDETNGTPPQPAHSPDFPVPNAFAATSAAAHAAVA